MPDLNTAYTWAINTCNAPNVGYSWPYRNQQTVNGITYYDCSSFIWYTLIAGGWDPESEYGSSWPFVTADMQPVLLRLGWQLVPLGGEWLPGDIVWRTGHVEMVYSGLGLGDGYTMGAHNYDEPLADQVSIRPLPASYYNTYTALYRYGAGGATTDGASPYVVAAILGNWFQESQFNPGLWQRKETGHTWTDEYIGYGLGQWTNTTGPNGRLYQLHEYLSTNGYADDSGEGELHFFIDENVWFSVGYASGYSDLQDFLSSNDTDIEALVRAFAQGWEGMIESSINIRIAEAKKWLAWIQTHGNDTPGAWVAGNRDLTVAEQENNALLIYRFLSVAGGGGGGNTPWITKKKMPLWMMCMRH